ncbi:A/B/D/E cyclin [Piedraia hortae CBS 480.64]|uniref:A/B/D/E cyclin n=1 Tax=Piedraia hortae CBS 480.64 TaxID=1314780 RepID=A0A6A7C6B5_9PEZI|nr:A/B/D/E cyclin [Piedraia hortae CBS 480.64]
MDAKPQRLRALRVQDENAPVALPAAVAKVAGMKSLNKRTKSSPALSALVQGGAARQAKKILGDVTNRRVVKDDSEIGKASPDKIVVRDVAQPAPAALTRPATRPVAPKARNAERAIVVKDDKAWDHAPPQSRHEESRRAVQSQRDSTDQRDALPVSRPNDTVETEVYDDSYVATQSFGLHGDQDGATTIIVMPECSEQVRRELRAAAAVVEETILPEDVEDEKWDISMVAEYGTEIFAYMRKLERSMAPNPRYMEQQAEIQWSMRAVLMDWVVQVHQRFNLLPETLFLTVNYIDRFLSCKVVSLNKLQLVGATAIFIAAKYEEVQCPTMAEIVYMVDGGYTAEELLKAERFMLSMLQFELGWPGPMSFLRRISKADDYDLETRTLAKYFLEITIMDERFVGCYPSYLAAGAHCLARFMLRKGDWTPAHVHYSQHTLKQLRPLLTALAECCEDPKRHHGAVFEKYSESRYKRAATFVSAEMARGFGLPDSRPW